MVTAALVLLLLVLAGPVCAEPVQEVPVTTLTVQPATPDVGEFLNPNTTFIHIPPQVFLTRTETDQFTTTVYGNAIPGSLNSTITAIRWDWGDNSTPEYHEFPHSHTYSGPGTYTLTVTAFQSDGQAASRTSPISIIRPIIPEITIGMITTTAPVQPAGPGVVASAPILTLLEPVTDGMNVTLNGNLNPGGPGVTISSVTIHWDDGNLTESPDLPVTHQYSQPGIYTVTITGEQTDGQSTTKGITVNIREENPGLPGPATSTPPPGELPVFFIILVTAITVVAIAVITQQIFHRKREASPLPDIPKPVADKEERYYTVKEKGDMAEAAECAHTVARMFRSLAEQSPRKRIFYLEMAETWETKARNAEQPDARAPPAQKPGRMPEHLPSREDLDRICSGTDIAPEILDAVIRVAVEIAREGREGQAVGTSFVVGDTETVLNNSRQFVLNPFHGHREEERQITDTGIRGNIKEFAQLDGAFIISGKGVVEAAGRYITVDMSMVKLAEGLGSRHSSIAGITRVTRSIGIVVSQSGGLISIFRDGAIVHTIGP
ncbi:MAG: PKD domain-containing protein [Methanomicrobiales archaeon]|nr:PKD domain-containing protein [Methanomicrobiales archaeon]